MCKDKMSNKQIFSINKSQNKMFDRDVNMRPQQSMAVSGIPARLNILHM